MYIYIYTHVYCIYTPAEKHMRAPSSASSSWRPRAAAIHRAGIINLRNVQYNILLTIV